MSESPQRWIVLLFSNLCWLFRARQDVAIHANMLWYVEEGEPKLRQAPDVMVIFGRPRGDRGSYKQWEEGGVAPQVVWEILSPSNRRAGVMEALEQLHGGQGGLTGRARDHRAAGGQRRRDLPDGHQQREVSRG